MKRNRKTIANQILIEGKGLHKARHNLLILKPSFNNRGILFINPDNGEKIEASIDNVYSLERGTSLGNERFKVHTIEHLFSALMAFEIDDLEIEINGDEIPILDGSSKSFVEILSKSRVIEKKQQVDYFEFEYGFELKSNGSYYRVDRADGFIIDCLFENDHPMIGKQRFVLEFNLENYIKEIAGARTFGFDYEIEYLRRNNLALGGSLENAVVLTKDGILNAGGLRFSDEFVRHKILDLIGDLKLTGLGFKDIKITAIKPSHKGNYDLAKLIYIRSLYGKAYNT